MSFALPVIERLLLKVGKSNSRDPKVLIMCPTRELAKQVHNVKWFY